MIRKLIPKVMVLLLFLTTATLYADERLPLSEIQLPPGFRISLYAKDVPDARSMALSAKGTLFVGTRQAGRVYAIIDQTQDGRADEVITIASGLTMPNGVAVRDHALYVAEVNRVLRFDNIERDLHHPPKPTLVFDRYPTETHHGWKFIAFGPDGHLYIPVGAPCNICNPDNPIFSTLTRLEVMRGQMTMVAHGLRNSVGFDWHPLTRELWFTDNGRDWAGDDRPPDELNRVSQLGLHFGFPYCHGRDFLDPDFGTGHRCTEFTPPVQELGPHVAALGMRFYTKSAFPPQYRNQIFIAEHGSWNRSKKIGYRVSLVTLADNRAVRYEPFAQGWLRPDGRVWGRPVDLLVMPDGALLISDDHAGAIYRITYEGS